MKIGLAAQPPGRSVLARNAARLDAEIEQAKIERLRGGMEWAIQPRRGLHGGSRPSDHFARWGEIYLHEDFGGLSFPLS